MSEGTSIRGGIFKGRAGEWSKYIYVYVYLICSPEAAWSLVTPTTGCLTCMMVVIWVGRPVGTFIGGGDSYVRVG